MRLGAGCGDVDGYAVHCRRGIHCKKESGREEGRGDREERFNTWKSLLVIHSGNYRLPINTKDKNATGYPPLPYLHALRAMMPPQLTFTPRFTFPTRIYHRLPIQTRFTINTTSTISICYQHHQHFRDICIIPTRKGTNQHTNKSINQQTRTSTATSTSGIYLGIGTRVQGGTSTTSLN